MNVNRTNDIVILLGAGASAEAGIPISAQMINELESTFADQRQKDLYHHVKSAIFFSAGLKGKFRDAVPYNIEVLVNTLNELERNEDHPLFPFIAAWNSRFVDLAGANFREIANFRQSILQRLKRWVAPDDPSTADYYKGLVHLQRDLTYPLQIFSLNYDLCVERLNCSDFIVETGFSSFGPQSTWEWHRFDVDGTSGTATPHVFLYKVHGSIDWKRDEGTKKLYRVEQIANVDADKLELIFGREVKMEAADPYLYFAYRFRELTLAAKVIAALGYGFGDGHINKMLAQSLRNDPNQRLVVVQHCENEEKTHTKHEEIVRALELAEAQKSQVIVEQGSVKDILTMEGLAAKLTSYMPVDPEAPF
jgi:hypothetical protein